MAASWLILQLADSAFPVGGFAHSGGLEAAAQLGEVKGDDFVLFAQEWIDQLAQGGLPLMSAAHENSLQLAMCAERADAFFLNHVANRSSRLQGRAFLDTSGRIFPDQSAELRSRVVKDGISTHHAPLFGATVGTLRVELEDAQRLYLSTQVRGMFSAAVRLNILGTLASQSLQHALAPHLEYAFERCRHLRLDDVCQTAPLLDLFSSTHDRLYSRLFLS